MKRRRWLASALSLLAACGPPKIWTGTSPDHRTGYEVFERGASTCVSVTGGEPRCFDGVALAGVVFSADSRSMAYPVMEDGAWFVVHDDRMGPPFDGIGDLVLAPDGERLAYVAQEARAWRVVVDGHPGPPVDSVFQSSLTMDPAGDRVAYVAAEDGRATVIVDGTPRTTHDGVADLRFASDGTRVAWVARDGDGSAVVVDGVAGRRHDAVGAYAFGPDGRVAYLARDGDGWWLRGADVTSGPHLAARALTYDRGIPTFVARDARGERVVRGGSPGPTFEEVDPPVFGTGRWGYVGRDSLESTVVLDGAPWKVDGWASDLAFDAHGRRHAYLMRRADTAFVVHDRGSEAFEVVARGTLHFTTAGCWAALVGSWSDRSLRVVVEGRDAARPFDWWDFAPAVLGRGREGEEEAAAGLRAWVAAEAELILAEAGDERGCG